MLAATVATLSSASKRPAPSSASPSGPILAQGSQSQPPQRSRTCQNSSPRAPVRPDPATGFAPLTLLGKKPLIKLAYRPPNYETPIEYFRSAITPNDAFFVRYHVSDIPQVDVKTWKVSIGGEGANAQAEITLDDLQKMPAFEIAAVNQCSGNRRGLYKPHVVGVQWGYGAMGCARWKGARLRDILDKVGVKKEAIEIVLDGADGPVVDKTPDFVKCIPVWKAMEETTIVAYEMNGQPLPRFNGFPARVIVPGWTGTYWMKHVTSINAVTKPFTGFWMNPAYRIPLRAFPLVERFTSQDSAVSTPITEMVVNSLITSHANRHFSGACFERHEGAAVAGDVEPIRAMIDVNPVCAWRLKRPMLNLGEFGH